MKKEMTIWVCKRFLFCPICFPLVLLKTYDKNISQLEIWSRQGDLRLQICFYLLRGPSWRPKSNK